MTLTETALVEPDVLERVLGSALQGGGDFAEVFVEDRTMTGISLDDRRVEELLVGARPWGRDPGGRR